VINDVQQIIQYAVKIIVPLLNLRARLQHRAGLRDNPTSRAAQSYARLGSIVSDSRILWRIWGPFRFTIATYEILTLFDGQAFSRSCSGSFRWNATPNRRAIYSQSSVSRVGRCWHITLSSTYTISARIVSSLLQSPPSGPFSRPPRNPSCWSPILWGSGPAAFGRFMWFSNSLI